MKLIDCDKSDASLWANSPVAKCVVTEVTQFMAQADRAVHKSLSERDAGKYEAYDKILEIFAELRGK